MMNGRVKFSQVLAVVMIGAFLSAPKVLAEVKNESAAGVVVTGGNTQTQSISLKDDTSYVFDANLIKFMGAFLKSSNSGVESAYKWSLGLRYERELSSTFSLFAGQNVESDKFQNILQRYNTDFGLKDKFYNEESFKWFGELGYRFTRTNYVTTFKNDNYLRLYTEAERFFNKSVSAKLWLEYLPNITESQAYKINTELSLSAALSDIFSVRSGYMIKFDNKPAAGVAYKTDSTFTTALVAKF